MAYLSFITQIKEIKKRTHSLTMLLFVLLATGQVLFGQSGQPTYQVTFQMHITGGGKTGFVDNATGLWKADKKHPAVIAIVNKDWMKVVSHGYPDYVQISHLTDSTSIKYYPISPTDRHAVKMAYEVPLTVPVLHSGHKGDKTIVCSSEDLPVSLLSDTQTVAGQLCQLARFNMTDSIGLDVWYVPDLPMLFWGEYGYLRQVPGLPLKIETYETGSDFKMGISATKVELMQAAPSLFALPKEYTLTKEIKIEAAPSQ